MNTTPVSRAITSGPVYRTEGTAALKRPARPALRLVEGGAGRARPRGVPEPPAPAVPEPISPRAFRWLLVLTVLTSVVAGEASLALSAL